MKKSIKLLLLVSLLSFVGCKNVEQSTSASTTENTETKATGQEGVVDDTSARNIVQTAIGSKDHTTLVAAVKAADLVTSLSNAGPFTVFAPLNSAFTSLNSEIPGGIAGVSASNMTKILQYHVVSNNILAADLTEGQVVTTLEVPQSFTVLLSTGPKLKDVNNRKASIITTDIQCSNGVIHLLSKVLLPTL
jgi:uncharacterized surface protein with fasciclin (FAS1) repeats